MNWHTTVRTKHELTYWITWTGIGRCGWFEQIRTGTRRCWFEVKVNSSRSQVTLDISDISVESLPSVLISSQAHFINFEITWILSHRSNPSTGITHPRISRVWLKSLLTRTVYFWTASLLLIIRTAIMILYLLFLWSFPSSFWHLHQVFVSPQSHVHDHPLQLAC